MAIIVCPLGVYPFGTDLIGALETFVYDGGCFDGTIFENTRLLLYEESAS